jgi:DNA-binding LacI/PurR family transcriptional regulator
MIGHHAVPVVVDAFLKGMLGKDEAERAYRAVKDSLTVCHKAASDATWGLLKEDWDILDRYGYYPFDKMRGEYNGMEVRGESVARTYECAYDDACAARFAAAIGKKADADFFRKRSAAWRNVFDASIGYARGKDSCGRWREPFNRYDCGSGPWADNDFCEGGSCQYTWHVMHDIAGLVEALGGRKNARERLDLLFADKVPGKEDRGFNYDISGCIGQYVHGNEPSHHIAYCYVYTDCPWKTGPVVRRIFDTQYGISPDGLCGNDDCGQMSAWYVFSALGFYPLDPCGGVYVIGAPQVPEARIRLGEWGTGNGEREFRIVAHNLSRENKYVKSVSLNGKPLVGRDIPNAPILRHSDIMAGGVLEFRHVSGVFLQPIECMRDSTRFNEEIVARLEDAGIYVTLLDYDIAPLPARSNCDVVGVDNFAAGYALGRHLRDRGKERVAFSCMPFAAPSVSGRLRGLTAALQDDGLRWWPGDNTMLCNPESAKDVAEFMRSHRPDAIVAYNDKAALALLKTFPLLGLSVPGDVLLAGFDDIPAASTSNPPLTTMAQPVDEIASAAFHTLVSRIKSPQLPPGKTLLHCRLVSRASTMAIARN